MANITSVRLKSDFKYYSGWSGVDPITQNEIIITPSHLDLISLAMLGKDLAIMAYRGRGKSTLMTLKYSSRRSTQHNKSVGVFSATEDLAIDKLRQIKAAFESDPNLHNYCAKGILTWTDKEIWLTDKQLVRKDESGNNIYPVISRLKAVGFDSRSRGLHFDIIVGDDIVIEENSLTPEGRPDPVKIAQTKKLFYEKVVPMRNPGGAIILIGTPQAYDPDDASLTDLLCERVYKKKKTSYILPALNENDEPNCPELHNKEFLTEQKTTLSSEAWMKEYMLTPSSQEKSAVDDEVIAKCLNEQERYYPDYIPKPHELMILGTDYSIIDNKFEAEKKKSDYFALVPICYEMLTNKRKIKNVFYERGLTFSDQLSKTKDFISRYGITVVAMELHGGMRYFMSELQKILPPHVTIVDATNHGSKFDTYKGLPSLQYIFQQQLIELSNATQEDKEKNQFLIHELKFMQTANHVDVLDAILRADTVIRTHYYSLTIDPNFSVRNINKDKIKLSESEMESLRVFGEPDKEKVKQALEAKQKDLMYQNMLNQQNKITFKGKRS